MKKVMWFIVASLLLLAACEQERQDTGASDVAEQLKQQAEQEASMPAEQTVEETPVETPVEQHVETVPEPVVEQAPVEMEEDIVEQVIQPSHPQTKLYEFLDTFAQRVTGYQFEHLKNEYYVRGNKYKIILNTPIRLSNIKINDTRYNFYWYDTVYVDRTNKNAIGYCEGQSSETKKQCAEQDLFDLPYALDYGKYNTTLPEDWLYAYLNRAELRSDRNKYYINGRSAVTVFFDDGNSTLEINFDESMGLPLRVDRKVGNVLIQRHDYNFLVANKVRDVDVKHRSKSEIPSSEVFYP